MPGGFTGSAEGRIVLRLDEVERVLLMSLCDQVMELVAPEPADPDADPLAAVVGIAAHVARPHDEVLLRLFPDAYADDDDAAGDFRRFTERDLRQAKLAHATAVRDCLERSGGKVVLSSALAGSWLGLLNDVRLALAVRIGIDGDFHDEVVDLPDDDPRLAMVNVYDWLTYLQDSLVQIMLP